MKKRMMVVAAASLLAVPNLTAAQASPAAGQDLVDVAQAAGSFTVLLQAVEAAGLMEVLRGDGPFTVFAPTDAAFARLPEGTVEALLADRDALIAVLTYHVLPGRVMAAEVVAAGQLSPETVQGSRLTIEVKEGRVHVDDATVVTADVAASNGVIHVIDTVVIPGR